jgi:hypothetical protein
MEPDNSIQVENKCQKEIIFGLPNKGITVDDAPKFIEGNTVNYVGETLETLAVGERYSSKKIQTNENLPQPGRRPFVSFSQF